MKEFNFYIAKKFFKIFFAVLITVILFTIIIDFVELARRLSALAKRVDGSDSYIGLNIILTLLKQPSLIIEIMPFIILLSALVFFTKLSNNSEIAIIKSSGMNMNFIFKIPILIIIIIFLIEALLINNYAVLAKRHYEDKLSDAIHESYRTSRKNIYSGSMWLQQHHLDVPYIFYVNNLELKQGKVILRDIDLLFLGDWVNDSDMSHKMLYAAQGHINNNKLHLYDVKFLEKISQNNSDVTMAELQLDTSLTNDFIIMLLNNNKVELNSMSLWQVVPIIFELKRNGFDGKQQIAFVNYYMAKLLLYLFLFLLAAFFCIKPPRQQNNIINIVGAVLTGFSSYFIFNISYSFVLSGHIPIMIGVWFFPILILLLIIYFIVKKELL